MRRGCRRRPCRFMCVLKQSQKSRRTRPEHASPQAGGSQVPVWRPVVLHVEQLCPADRDVSLRPVCPPGQDRPGGPALASPDVPGVSLVEKGVQPGSHVAFRTPFSLVFYVWTVPQSSVGRRHRDTSELQTSWCGSPSGPCRAFSLGCRTGTSRSERC